MRCGARDLYSAALIQCDFRLTLCSFFFTDVATTQQHQPDFPLIQNILTQGQALWNQARAMAAQYPRQITSVVAAILLGGGGAAFAVATLAPDAADMPVQQVLETVHPLALATTDTADMANPSLF